MPSRQAVHQRVNRAIARENRPHPVSKASSTGGINLLRAGLERGRSYRAVPQGDGAILLLPL